MKEQDKFSLEEYAEIDRVNKLTRKTFRNVVLDILIRKGKNSPKMVDSLMKEIFDDSKINLVITGQENIQEESVVYACNHSTHSAKNFLLPKNPIWNYALPYYLLETARQLDILSDRETDILFSADNNGMKKLVEASGNIPVLRKNRSMTSSDRDVLNSNVREAILLGKNLIVAPEGKFWGEMDNNDINNIGPFQKGTAHMARDNNVPIVPVILKGFSRAGNTEFSIDIKEPLIIGVDETAAVFMARVRQVFINEGFTPVE